MCGARRSGSGDGGAERGSASVELIGALPFLGLALLLAVQIALAGAALWGAAVSARAGARAVAIGREARPAARRALPTALRGGARVSDRDGVRVRVRVPRLLPGHAAAGGRGALGAGRRWAGR